MSYEGRKRTLGEANTCIITAVVVIQVIDERSLLSVVEENANHAEASQNFRVSLLDHPALSPLRKLTMDNPITDF
jgi:hypothetical protein